jgi:hypothetical protein
VHQQSTWNNNPFAALTDTDEEEEDDDTVVPSNCSPRPQPATAVPTIDVAKILILDHKLYCYISTHYKTSFSTSLYLAHNITGSAISTSCPNNSPGPTTMHTPHQQPTEKPTPFPHATTHDLWHHHSSKWSCPTLPKLPPYNIIEPDDNLGNQSTPNPHIPPQ